MSLSFLMMISAEEGRERGGRGRGSVEPLSSRNP